MMPCINSGTIVPELIQGTFIKRNLLLFSFFLTLNGNKAG
jgi:hypothetical protein